MLRRTMCVVLLSATYLPRVATPMLVGCGWLAMKAEVLRN